LLEAGEAKTTHDCALDQMKGKHFANSDEFSLRWPARRPPRVSACLVGPINISRLLVRPKKEFPYLVLGLECEVVEDLDVIEAGIVLVVVVGLVEELLLLVLVVELFEVIVVGLVEDVVVLAVLVEGLLVLLGDVVVPVDELLDEVMLVFDDVDELELLVVVVVVSPSIVAVAVEEVVDVNTSVGCCNCDMLAIHDCLS
jgi:hypothetical protein